MKCKSPQQKYILAVGVMTATMAISACASHPSNSPATAAASSAAASASPSVMQMSPTGTVAQPLRAGERFLNLTVPQPYTPVAPSGGTDEYRCLIVDPHLNKPAFLTGTQFDPQNVPIVHHAVIFSVAPGPAAAAARAQDAATPGEGWTCFGTLDTTPSPTWIDTWTPNGKETILQQNVGFSLQPGSLLVLQIHYNLLASGGHPAGSDQSRVRLRLTDGTSATKPLETVNLQAPTELPCPKDESGPLCSRTAAVADVAKRFGNSVGATADKLVSECSHGVPVPGSTQHCDIPVEQPMTVYAAMGHMHLLGRSIKIELNPGTTKAQTLLDVPNFNFDDQRLTPLPTPVNVKPGDTLRVTCTHDASLREKLPALRKLPPRYVVWGDGTSDEMCLGLLTASLS
jgi:hypothetical protein